MKIYEKTGKMALGSRLRQLTATMTDDASKIYEMYDAQFVPKWFPAFFALAEEGPQTITEIADYIGHSQPSATKIIKEMTTSGLCENIKSSDKRRNTVQLTEKGILLSKKFLTQYLDIDAAVDKMLKEATHNLWQAVEEWEFLLEKQSLLKRVQEQKKLRESKDVVIVPYEDKYLSAFVTLNREWITQYFEMEDEDFKVLNNPEEYILKSGGKIFVALYMDEPVGVCALHKIDEHTYEMVKMAVSPKAQGKSIGWLLGKAVVEEATRLGAYKVTLESNTILKPAIKLYEKLGFKKVASHPSPFKRANIHMELNL